MKHINIIMATVVGLFWSQNSFAKTGDTYECKAAGSLPPYFNSNGKARLSLFPDVGAAGGSASFGGAGFREGHPFPILRLHLYDGPGRKARENKNVWVYRGSGNNASEGRMLIYNDFDSVVMIVDLDTYSSYKFDCSLLSGQ